MLAALALTIVVVGGQAGRQQPPPTFREFSTGDGGWIQGATTLKAMHGKIVLLDFFDYTCVNCIRTFPYLKEWYRRYHRDGLEIVGIHTPEFQFAQDPATVRAAVQRLGLPWHVLNDPKRSNWWMYGAWAWPTHILLGPDGRVQLFRVGEGNYGLFEQNIQKQLHALHPALKFPPLMQPIRAADKPGAVCYPMTPEIYTSIKGFPKGELSYTPDDVGKTKTFSFPANPKEGVVYLSGSWTPQKHWLEAAGEGSSVLLKYEAKEVNVVLTPTQDVYVEVLQDGKPLDKDRAGDDVGWLSIIAEPMFGSAKPKDIDTSAISARAPRMYSVIKNPKWGHHTLELRALGPGLQIVTFSFSSDCDPKAKPPKPKPGKPGW